MKVHTTRLLAAMAVMALALGTSALSATEESGTPETETLYIAAGCPPSDETGATCTSTRWLGTEPGDSSSNFLTATTPVDEVYAQTGAEPNWRDYASDHTLRTDGYPLRTDEPLRATVTIRANVIAANNTVHARITGRTVDGQNVTLGPLQQIVTVLPQSQEEVEFSFELPAELEGVALRNLVFYTAVHGINAQGGYIDQQGGSTVEIPYWEPAEAPIENE